MIAPNCFKMLLCAAGLAFFSASAQAADATKAPNRPSQRTEAIPWDQIGAKAGADYQGDGLAVAATKDGARLRCVFQRLDGEATAEGLWLASTATNAPGDRFRVVATAVGGQALAARGTVTVEGQTVRFTRAGLVEEYSVSMDGVRQDFVIEEPPGRREAFWSAAAERSGDAAIGRTSEPLMTDNCRTDEKRCRAPLATALQKSELVVSLAVTGARVEPATYGAQLVLEKSGRKLAYSRLRATDASGKKLPVRIAAEPNSEKTLAVVVNDAGAVYPVRIDPTFSDANWSALGSGVNGDVYALAVSGGTLYAGGTFTSAGGVAANYIAQWNGNSWSALGSGMNDVVQALAVSGGALYAGGYFTNAGGIAANNIAQWNGNSWSALGSGLNNGVNALAVSGGTLYAGGFFTTAGDTAANYIAQWNGSSWSALGSGMSGAEPPGPYVSALAVSGTNLYAGGAFGTAGGITVNNIAQWNGSSWSSLGPGFPVGFPGGHVLALAVSGGVLYAGGYIGAAGGTYFNNIAQWDGSNWSALGSGMDTEGEVYALAVSGTNLYAGGAFHTAGGNAAHCIAQWDGNSWSAMGSGVNSDVEALAVSGGTLFAGGYFTTAGSQASAYVAETSLLGPVFSFLTANGNFGFTNGQFLLTLVGPEGSNAVISASADLQSWTPLVTNPLTGGTLQFTDTVAPNYPMRFYRAKLMP